MGKSQLVILPYRLKVLIETISFLLLIFRKSVKIYKNRMKKWYKRHFLNLHDRFAADPSAAEPGFLCGRNQKTGASFIERVGNREKDGKILPLQEKFS